jgi:hypothetical protein
MTDKLDELVYRTNDLAIELTKLHLTIVQAKRKAKALFGEIDDIAEQLLEQAKDCDDAEVQQTVHDIYNRAGKT